MRSERIEFTGSQGDTLAAKLELPSGPVRAFALFAHCFSCSKDIFAATRIARGLAEKGYGVLRFDFTGLGASKGDFANTNFSSNVQDLLAAARWLEDTHEGPSLLVGHSLGGAAVLVAAHQIASVRAVATLAAPADTEHVQNQFAEFVPEIEAEGIARVKLAGRPFTIKKQFLEDIRHQNVEAAIKAFRGALLVTHGPLDQAVGIDNATRIFVSAKHPKSFVSLDGADHLLTRREDAVYAADVIASWAAKYVGGGDLPEPPKPVPGDHGVHVQETGVSPLQNHVVMGEHVILADEPEKLGGRDSGPDPYDLLTGALGICTSMTLRLYADRKGWPLERVGVKLVHEKQAGDDLGIDADRPVDVFDIELELEGPLDDDQRARLHDIAKKCPVHRTLTGPVVIRTANSG